MVLSKWHTTLTRMAASTESIPIKLFSLTDSLSNTPSNSCMEEEEDGSSSAIVTSPATDTSLSTPLPSVVATPELSACRLASSDRLRLCSGRSASQEASEACDRPRLRRRRHTYPDQLGSWLRLENGCAGLPPRPGDVRRHRSGPHRGIDAIAEKQVSPVHGAPSLVAGETGHPLDGCVLDDTRRPPLLLARRRSLLECRLSTGSADELSRKLEVALVRVDGLPAYRQARRNCPDLLSTSGESSTATDVLNSSGDSLPTPDVPRSMGQGSHCSDARKSPEGEVKGDVLQVTAEDVNSSCFNVNSCADGAVSSVTDKTGKCAELCARSLDRADETRVQQMQSLNGSEVVEEFREQRDEAAESPGKSFNSASGVKVLHECDIVIQKVEQDGAVGVIDLGLVVNGTDVRNERLKTEWDDPARAFSTPESLAKALSKDESRIIEDASSGGEILCKLDSCAEKERKIEASRCKEISINDDKALGKLENQRVLAKRLRSRSGNHDLNEDFTKLAKRPRKESHNTDSSEPFVNGVEEHSEVPKIRRSSRSSVHNEDSRKRSLEESSIKTRTRNCSGLRMEQVKLDNQNDKSCDSEDDDDSKPLAFLCRPRKSQSRFPPDSEVSDGANSDDIPLSNRIKTVTSEAESPNASNSALPEQPKQDPEPVLTSVKSPFPHEEKAHGVKTEKTKNRLEDGEREEGQKTTAKETADDGSITDYADDSATESLPEATISPPVLDARRKRYRRLNEAQKLFLNSDCHKMEILTTKLRHTPGRLSGAAAAASTPKLKIKVKQSTPPLLVPNGDSDSCSPRPPAKKRRRRLLELRSSASPRQSESPRPERLCRAAAPSPVYAGSESSDGPPHLEPEVSLTPPPTPHRRGRGATGSRGWRGGGRTPRVGARPPREEGRSPRRQSVKGGGSRGGRGGLSQLRRRSSDSDSDPPAPALREAAAETAVAFAFESAPLAEEWFRTFARQEEGDSAVPDWSSAASGGGVKLPYQLSQQELYPPALVPGGGRPRPAMAVTLPDRWLPPLPTLATPAPEPAPTRTDRRQRRRREGIATPSSVASDEVISTDAMQRLLLCLRTDDLPKNVGPGAVSMSPDRAETLCGWSAASLAPELDELLVEMDCVAPEPPSRPASSLSTATSVGSVSSGGSTDSASVSSSGERRRPVKRRKNKTGWPRAKVRKSSSLLKRAMNRAAAEAAEDRDCSLLADSPAPS